jgi:cellulose synthase/poly-beta-1,6-N-acetylglucosamine synthase-like glycosyltransferase
MPFDFGMASFSRPAHLPSALAPRQDEKRTYLWRMFPPDTEYFMTPPTGTSYVLITAVHNEESFIERTLRSIGSQKLLPKKWVIVSDRSTDRTDTIVERARSAYPFIELLRVGKGQGRDFAAKVNALRRGYQQLEGLDYGFIGILDGDIEVDPLYYGNILGKFEEDPRLGLAGGFVYDQAPSGKYKSRRHNRVFAVAGGIQLFRRECFEAIGSLQPLKYGGEDWCAEISAKMRGWKVQSFPELTVFHLRPTGTGGNLVGYWFGQGQMDFSLGSLPLFVIVKCLRRLPDRPMVIGGCARLLGFGCAYLRRARRLAPQDVIRYLREEQRQRLWAMLRFEPQEQPHFTK